jgi:hypothetical protein
LLCVVGRDVGQAAERVEGKICQHGSGVVV